MFQASCVYLYALIVALALTLSIYVSGLQCLPLRSDRRLGPYSVYLCFRLAMFTSTLRSSPWSLLCLSMFQAYSVYLYVPIVALVLTLFIYVSGVQCLPLRCDRVLEPYSVYLCFSRIVITSNFLSSP